MDSAAILMYMTSLCILLTSSDGNTITKFEALDAGLPREIIIQEKTTRARSKVECAIHCRRDPFCVSFAYIRASSSCYLHPTSTDVHKGNTTGEMTAVYLQSDQGCRYIPFTDSSVSVAIQHSLHLAEANVTCKNDYYPPGLHVQVNCSTDGDWSDVACLKRLWTYPEGRLTICHQTRMSATGSVTFQIPGPVTEAWSVCVQGTPLDIDWLVIEILDASESISPLHTSWRMDSNTTVINDYINFQWGLDESKSGSVPTTGQPFDFRLTLNTSTIAQIYMNSQFVGNWTLQLPLSSFAKINCYGNMNVTKVEAWCQY